LRAPADVRFVMAMRAHMHGILIDQQASKVYFENEADLPRPIRTELRAVMREIETIFVRIVSEGVQSGVFRSDDPVMTVRHAMALCAWPYRWYSPSGKLSRADFVDSAIDFALSALRTGSSLNSVAVADIKSRRGRNPRKTARNS
jgi:Tetracyclin repressor-like, C-terminal domain